MFPSFECGTHVICCFQKTVHVGALLLVLYCPQN
jgi:hypothetical protein